MALSIDTNENCDICGLKINLDNRHCVYLRGLQRLQKASEERKDGKNFFCSVNCFIEPADMTIVQKD